MYTTYEKALVIIPKIISIFSSIAILRDLLKGPRAKLEQMTIKVLIAMNISDLLCTSISFAPIFGSSAFGYNAALAIVFLLS